jgi:hypothetical protein
LSTPAHLCTLWPNMLLHNIAAHNIINTLSKPYKMVAAQYVKSHKVYVMCWLRSFQLRYIATSSGKVCIGGHRYSKINPP